MKMIDVDVMFGANYFLPRLLAAVARRRVVTIHDLTYKRFPELLQKETLINLEHHMQRELAHADAAICVSESTRQDLLAFYDIDPSRAVTILSGIVASPTPDSRHPTPCPKNYILFVSTIEPRKNLDVLLDAFARLRARGAYDGALVVVGSVGWKSESIIPRLRAPGVHHLDYVRAGAARLDLPQRGAVRLSVDLRRLRLSAARGDGATASRRSPRDRRRCRKSAATRRSTSIRAMRARSKRRWNAYSPMPHCARNSPPPASRARAQFRWDVAAEHDARRAARARLGVMWHRRCLSCAA